MKNIIFLITAIIVLCTCKRYEQYRTTEDKLLIRGRNCYVCIPSTTPNHKWIVRPAFHKEFNYVDTRLLQKGYHVVFYDVTNEFGNTKAQSDFEVFYKMTKEKYQLQDKFIFEGFSRGGYFALMYAITHPEQVDKIYLDAPVCDLYSWPKDKEPLLYEDAKAKWESCGVDIDSIHDMPITDIDSILQKDIPIIICYGEEDTIVPYSENFGKIIIPDNYPFLSLPKKGCGHHPHSLKDCQPIIDFLDSDN